jgi:hypothetical protein
MSLEFLNNNNNNNSTDISKPSDPNNMVYIYFKKINFKIFYIT